MLFYFLLAAAPPAQPPVSPYAGMDDWRFYRTAQACSMRARDLSGTDIQVAKAPAMANEVVLMVGNASWTSLRVGQTYDASIYMGDEKVAAVRPVAMAGTEHMWLAWRIRRPVAAEMFQRGGHLNIYHQNRHLAHRALDPFDKKAFDELSRCSGMPEDPFAE